MMFTNLFSSSENIAMESKIYSYGKSINAFAARLLPEEAKRLSGLKEISKKNNLSFLNGSVIPTSNISVHIALQMKMVLYQYLKTQSANFLQQDHGIFWECPKV